MTPGFRAHALHALSEWTTTPAQPEHGSGWGRIRWQAVAVTIDERRMGDRDNLTLIAEILAGGAQAAGGRRHPLRLVRSRPDLAADDLRRLGGAEAAPNDHLRAVQASAGKHPRARLTAVVPERPGPHRTWTVQLDSQRRADH